MSALDLGTPAANAKQVRELSQALKSLNDSSRLYCFNAVLVHTSASRALATLSKEDADQLFSAVQAGLVNPNPYSRNASLRVAVLLSKHAPPSLVADHWASLTSRITSILKSARGVNRSLTAQALAAVASLITAGAPLTLEGGNQKVSITTACHSAVVHVTRFLEGDPPSGDVALASIALLFAILNTAPRELRQVLPRLELALWHKWVGHPLESVRQASAKLLAHLLICCPEKVKQKVFDERIESGCTKLDEIMNILDHFTSARQSRRAITPSMLLAVADSKEQAAPGFADRLSHLYSAASFMLREVLNHGSPTPLFISIPKLLHTLCRGFSQRQIDLYTPDLEGVALNADDVLRLIAITERECLRTLVTLTESVDRSALLPYVHVLAQAFHRRLSYMILKVQTAPGAVAAIAQRSLLFDAMARIVMVLGCGFIEQILEPFVKLFECDIEIYSKAAHAQSYLLSKSSSAISESTRFRKRRKVANARNREAHTKELSTVDSTSDKSVTWASETVRDLQTVLISGTRLVTAIVENRGLLGSRAVDALHRIEILMERIERFSTSSTDFLEIIRAIALGGGPSRLVAEASPFLLRCLSLSNQTTLSMASSPQMRISGLRMRSTSELLLHPRGPPVVRAKVLRRNASDHQSPMTGFVPQQQKKTTPHQLVDDGPQGTDKSDAEMLEHRKEDGLSSAFEGNRNDNLEIPSGDNGKRLEKAPGRDEKDRGAGMKTRAEGYLKNALDSDQKMPVSEGVVKESTENQGNIDTGVAVSAGTAASTIRESVAGPGPVTANIPHLTSLQNTPGGVLHIAVEAGEGNSNALAKESVDGAESGEEMIAASPAMQPAAMKDTFNNSSSDVDEDALVASLTFEPPDEE